MQLSLADLRAFASKIAQRLENDGLLIDDTNVAAATTPIAEELAEILKSLEAAEGRRS